MDTHGKVDAVVADTRDPYGMGMHGGKIGKAEYEIHSEWDNEAPNLCNIVDLVCQRLSGVI